MEISTTPTDNILLQMHSSDDSHIVSFCRWTLTDYTREYLVKWAGLVKDDCKAVVNVDSVRFLFTGASFFEDPVILGFHIITFLEDLPWAFYEMENTFDEQYFKCPADMDIYRMPLLEIFSTGSARIVVPSKCDRHYLYSGQFFISEITAAKK